jgi:predicted RNase H-like HicB family nuclease
MKVREAIRLTAMRYAIAIEKADGNYSAYVPDLPGCVAIGGMVKDAEREIREAICFHIDGLKQDVRRCRSRPALPIMVGRENPLFSTSW